MSEATVCDRCGEVEKRPAKIDDVVLKCISMVSNEIPRKADLCADCEDDLEEWWYDG